MSGRKPLLFVMAEDTEAADQIAHRLNSDPLFAELNGRTLNLHTNLKGRLVKRGRGLGALEEFVESEKSISDEDLRALRKLSRDLDSDISSYRAICSVLMLREGWDVKNVTTIVPLRPLSAKSRILPEQTLGRGLRRMTPPGDGVGEILTVVEHKAFSSLYSEELSQEGLPLTVVDVNKIPRMTVTVFPDPARDLENLDIEIPQLTAGYRIEPVLEGLVFEDVIKGFARYLPLPLGHARQSEIDYEGRTLITDEIVERMKIKLPLLSDGVGAVSFFREELERATKVRNAHPILAPLLRRFLEDVLFEEKVSLFDDRLVARLGDADVREIIRAVFVPLIRSRITYKQERSREAAPQSVLKWKPFQATHSESRPAEVAVRTPFNLVPCDRQFEVAMVHYLDRCEDVAAFAKNAGPQKLTIDCLNAEGRRALYWPDFIVRKRDGGYLVIETKGRADRDAGPKALGAVEWCKAAAATTKKKWSYVYVEQGAFERLTGSTVEELVRAASPGLISVLEMVTSPQLQLDLGRAEAGEAGKRTERFVDPLVYSRLPPRYQRAIDDAIALFSFQCSKSGASLSPIFQPLLGPLDNAAEGLMAARLGNVLPVEPRTLDRFFVVQPVSGDKGSRFEFLLDKSKMLRKLLVHRAPLMPTGLLIFCLEYARGGQQQRGGILDAVGGRFRELSNGAMLGLLQQVYEFRNTYIAHQKQELTVPSDAEAALVTWIRALVEMHEAAAVSAASGP
jgi:type III restriction enzyme